MKPTYQDVLAAADRLAPYLGSPTPLFHSAGLSELLDADVWLKVETMGPIASFKLRGALNALLSLPQRPASAVTSSTGNHGQGVAYAARLLGLSADIFVPEGSVAEKMAAIQRFGGRLFVEGTDIDDAKDRARAHAAHTGGAFIDDGEDAAVIAGAGTVGLEAARTLENIEVALVPMGSGSLAGGVALAMKGVQPTARIWAVQSDGSPAMVESFHARHPIERPVDTIGDCLMCRVPALTALDTLIEAVDDALLVTDDDLLRSIGELALRGRVLVEPGAAAALAGAWARRQELRDKRVLLVLTGANIASHVLSRVFGRGDAA